MSFYHKQAHENARYELASEKKQKQKDTTPQKSMERGEEIYADFCAQCHQGDGMGVAGTFPPLAKADFLLENVDKSINTVKFGLNGEITVSGKTYADAMPYLGLYDDEIADMMNYILNSWGNEHEKIITEEYVGAIKK